MTERMPGRAAQPWCPICHAPPGPDCPDRSRSPRQIRQQLKRDLHSEINTMATEEAARTAHQQTAGEAS